MDAISSGSVDASEDLSISTSSLKFDDDVESEYEDLALEDSEKDDAEFSDHQRKSMAEYDNDASDERKQQQDILELLNAKQEHRLLVCGRWTVLLLFIAIAGVTGWLIHNSITQQQRQEMEEDVSVLIWLL